MAGLRGVGIINRSQGHNLKGVMIMGEKIQWQAVGYATRQAVVELCGWANSKGNATPTGKRIAQTDWPKLTPAARVVLSRHGISE